MLLLAGLGSTTVVLVGCVLVVLRPCSAQCQVWTFAVYAAVMQRIKALMWREFTLIKRTFVVYKAKTLQVVIVALVAATLFLRTHIHPVSPNDGQEIAGFCFFATLVMLFNGIAELSMSVSHPPPLVCPLYYPGVQLCSACKHWPYYL